MQDELAPMRPQDEPPCAELPLEAIHPDLQPHVAELRANVYRVHVQEMEEILLALGARGIPCAHAVLADFRRTAAYGALHRQLATRRPGSGAGSPQLGPGPPPRPWPAQVQAAGNGAHGRGMPAASAGAAVRRVPSAAAPRLAHEAAGGGSQGCEKLGAAARDVAASSGDYPPLTGSQGRPPVAGSVSDGDTLVPVPQGQQLEPLSVRGLENPANRSFANSAAQALAGGCHLLALLSGAPPGSSVRNALAELVQPRAPSEGAGSVAELLAAAGPPYNDGGQHDCTEFTCAVLDNMGVQGRTVCCTRMSEQQLCACGTFVTRAEEHSVLGLPMSMLHRAGGAGGQARSSTGGGSGLTGKPLRAAEARRRQNLSSSRGGAAEQASAAAQPPAISLESCVDRLASSLVPAETCSMCILSNVPLLERRVRVERILRAAPRMLVLQLMRFATTGAQTVKLDAHVIFPTQLRLGRAGALLSVSLTGPHENELTAVVEHMGTTARNGHYVAYVRRGDAWQKASDTLVAPVEEREVLLANAYMLFYDKK